MLLFLTVLLFNFAAGCVTVIIYCAVNLPYWLFLSKCVIVNDDPLGLFVILLDYIHCVSVDCLNSDLCESLQLVTIEDCIHYIG